jgi:hypothetical protein
VLNIHSLRLLCDARGLSWSSGDWSRVARSPLFDECRPPWSGLRLLAYRCLALEPVAKSCATFRFVIHVSTPPASLLTDSTIGCMEASGEAAAERP